MTKSKATKTTKAPVNMKMGVSKGKLRITVDLNDFLEKATPSASGASYSIASSKGNVNLESPEYKDIKLGLNVYIPKARFEELKRIKEIDEAGGQISHDFPAESTIAKQAQEIAELKSMMATLLNKLG